jgi:hypothetical protein
MDQRNCFSGANAFSSAGKRLLNCSNLGQRTDEQVGEEASESSFLVLRVDEVLMVGVGVDCQLAPEDHY